ncbi:hypothetical protein EYF80_005693 [Liparis tanakae]|uniref:Uncharacterized protein n=1 Tax=Liparis tanakae TaxID=230148 RepID=A0A4Z2J238_9TELE|nr:hypothetical protein EYF80_005693 [Liparis tanakae]
MPWEAPQPPFSSYLGQGQPYQARGPRGLHSPKELASLLEKKGSHLSLLPSTSSPRLPPFGPQHSTFPGASAFNDEMSLLPPQALAKVNGSGPCPDTGLAPGQWVELVNVWNQRQGKPFRVPHRVTPDMAYIKALTYTNRSSRVQALIYWPYVMQSVFSCSRSDGQLPLLEPLPQHLLCLSAQLTRVPLCNPTQFPHCQTRGVPHQANTSRAFTKGAE